MMRGHYRERFAITIIIAAAQRFMARGSEPKKRAVTGAPKGWINNDGIGGGDGDRRPGDYGRLPKAIFPSI